MFAPRFCQQLVPGLVLASQLRLGIPFLGKLLDLRLDLERETVILTIRNVNMLGATRYTLSPEKMTEQLLDELAKMILRKPHQFDDMMGNKLTRTGIHRIREKLHAQEAAGTPVAGEVAVSPALQSAAPEGGLGRRLLRVIKRG